MRRVALGLPVSLSPHPGSNAGGGPVPTLKRGMVPFGGSGTGAISAAALVEMNDRRPVKLPVSTTRWRLRIANADAGALITGAFNFAGFAIGEAALSGGVPTGLTTATPVNVQGAFTTNSGADWISPWITDPAAQLQAGVIHLLCLGWFAPSGFNVGRGNGRYLFRSGSGASAGYSQQNPGAFSVGNGLWIDVRLEYECLTNKAMGLVIGDSNTEALTSPTTFIQDTWPYLAAAQLGAPMSSTARGGQSTATFANPNVWDWVRLGTELTPDYGDLNLGINSTNGLVPLATYQSEVAATKDNAIARFPTIKRFYAHTIAPRNYASPGSDANETLRLSYNTWWRTIPSGFNGVTDNDLILRDPSNQRQLLPAYNSGDALHMTPAGHAAEGAAAALVLPAT